MDPRIIEMLQAQKAAQNLRFPGVEPASVEVLDNEDVKNEAGGAAKTEVTESKKQKLDKKVNYYQPYLGLPPGKCDIYVYVAINNKIIVKHGFMHNIEPEVFKKLRMYFVFWSILGQVHDKYDSFTDKGTHLINVPDINYWHTALCKKQNIDFPKPEYIRVEQKPFSIALKEIRIYSNKKPLEFMKFK